jgi:hypothetical protein
MKNSLMYFALKYQTTQGKMTEKTGFSQSHRLCENLGLTAAGSRKKRGTGAAEKRTILSSYLRGFSKVVEFEKALSPFLI